MSKIVKTITNVVYGFILVFGFYVIIHGHVTPGGGFQGGAIVASAFALLLVAYGTKNFKNMISKEKFAVFESVGAIAFIILAFLGIGTTFFHNFMANSGLLFSNMIQFGSNPGDLNTAGVIPLMNMSVGLKVLTGIGSILFLMSIGGMEVKDD